MGRKKAAEKAPKTKILVGVPKDLRDALQRMADKDERTLTDFVRLILKRYVESAKGGKR